MFASGWVSDDCRHSASCGRKKVLPDSLFSYPTEPKKELQLDDFRFNFPRSKSYADRYRYLLCPNIVLPKLFFFFVLEKWTDFQSFFSFCFTLIFRVSHITVSSWRFDLNVWFQSLPNVFPVFCFAPKILNFAAYHTSVSFYSFSRFHVDFLFERFPIITGFPFSRAVSVKPNLINLVPFHPEEPKSYTFKFYKFFSLYIFSFFFS